MIGNIVGVLFDGLAYGSLLFIIAVGLSVTLGLMNFINLAHGAFAMVGGYVCVLMMTRLGAPFLLTLPVAFIVAALVGVLLERTLYQRLYGANHLDQVLFSIGLVFMSIAIATYFFGASQQPVSLPSYLRGQVHFLGVDTRDLRSDGEDMVTEFGLTYPSVFDQGERVRIALKQAGIPVTLFVDPAGKVVHLYNGTRLDEATLSNLVKQHLGVAVPVG